MTDKRFTIAPDETLVTEVNSRHEFGDYRATLHKDPTGGHRARFHGVSGHRTSVFHGKDNGAALHAFNQQVASWAANEVRLNQKAEQRRGH